jgi:DNA invertase Pin-like site-specific DNA recombinase
VLVCWRLDRLGRNLKHLITLLDELSAIGVAFVSLAEGIDATTPAGKLQMHILGAIAEFERGRIVERLKAGLERARAQGVRLGRPRRRVEPERLAEVVGLPEREAARRLGIPRSTFQRFVRAHAVPAVDQNNASRGISTLPRGACRARSESFGGSNTCHGLLSLR